MTPAISVQHVVATGGGLKLPIRCSNRWIQPSWRAWRGSWWRRNERGSSTKVRYLAGSGRYPGELGPLDPARSGADNASAREQGQRSDSRYGVSADTLSGGGSQVQRRRRPLKRSACAAVLAYLIGVASASSQEADWYEKVAYRCENAGSAATALLLNDMLATSYDVAGRSANLYFRIPKDTFDNVYKGSSRSTISASRTLNDESARIMRTHYSGIGTVKVPFFVNAAASGAASLFPGGALALLYKTAWTTFRALLMSGSSAAEAMDLALLMANGGVLTEILTASYDEKKRPFASRSINYSVRVGNEQRHYNLLSCTFAVKIT